MQALKLIDEGVTILFSHQFIAYHRNLIQQILRCEARFLERSDGLVHKILKRRCDLPRLSHHGYRLLSSTHSIPSFSKYTPG